MMTTGARAATGSTDLPIQRRPIAPAVYRDFDANAAQEPTKKLLLAASQEDEVDGWSVEAGLLFTRLQGLTADAMVGAQASLALAGALVHVTNIQAKKKLIGLFIDAMVKGYAEALDPSLYGAKFDKIRDIRERLAAKTAATQEQARRINEKNDKKAEFVTGNHADAKAALQQLRATVTDLEDQAKAQHAAKASYEQNEKAFTAAQASGGTLEHAQALGVTVSADIDLQFQAARRLASETKWSGAGLSSDKGRRLLESLQEEVRNTQKSKDAYESIKSDFSKLKGFRDEFARLQIQDDPRLGEMSDARRAADDAAGRQDWSTAAREAKKFAPLVAPVEQLIASFAHYRDTDPPRLLVGTLVRIFEKLRAGAAYTNTDALSLMETTLVQQCDVTRLNWLEHLNIAGDNVKVGGDADHYTTFNTSVPAATIVSVSVYDDSTRSMRSTDDICNDLFTVAPWYDQIHATRVVGVNRYHRYWDGHESPNVGIDGFAAHAAYADLTARHAQMIRDMRAGVEVARRNFGRVARNERGQQLAI